MQQTRTIYLAAIPVFATFCLYLGLEGIDSAFVAMGAPSGVFPHPEVLASFNFLAVLPFLLMSAKSERRWSRFLLLFISANSLVWAGAGVQFGLAIREVLISLATGLAGLFLFLALLKLKRTSTS